MEGSGQDLGLNTAEQALFVAEYPRRDFPFYYDFEGKLLPWSTGVENPEAKPSVKGLGSFAHVRLWLKVQRMVMHLYGRVVEGKKE